MKKLKLLASVLSIAIVLSSCATTNGTAKKTSDFGPSEIVPFTGTDYTPLPAGTDGTAGKKATYVLFGDWPQTIKSASVTVYETTGISVGMFTYYYGSDGAWYAKCKENAYEYESDHKYSDGTTVAQSTANSTKYFKVEPIKWRVLTDSYNGKKLLLAENILINCAYYDCEFYLYYDVDRIIGGSTVYPNNYKESRVRAYLNGFSYTKKSSDSVEQVTDSTFEGNGFLQTAFTASAQSRIAMTTVDNSAKSTSDSGNNLEQASSYICENTIDKIFLLSEQEVTKEAYGFAAYDVYKDDGNGTTESTRIRMTTDYAKASGAYKNSTAGYGGIWWLRSSRFDCISARGDLRRGGARVVDFDGYADDDDLESDFNAGVVPALSIN